MSLECEWVHAAPEGDPGSLVVRLGELEVPKGDAEDVEGDIWAVGVEVEMGVAMDRTVGEGVDPDASSAAGSGDPGRCAEHGARPRTH